MTAAVRRRGCRVRIVATGTVLSAALAACGAPDPTPSGQAGVTDDLGRSHATTPARTRVVSLIPGITELVVAVDAADRLVGRTRYDTDPRLEALPSVGGGIDPSLEAIVALEPDLVVAWADRDPGGVIERLGALGVPVYAARTESLADLRSHARNLGTLLGARSRADSLVRAIDEGLLRIGERTRGAEPPTVLYLVWHDPPMTSGPGTFVDSLVTASGGRNAFGDSRALWPRIGLEEIVRRQPDFVIVADETVTAAAAAPPTGSGAAAPSAPRGVPSWLVESPGWRELRAVRQGRVLLVDPNLFGRPGPGVVEAARILARALHPERFPEGEIP